MRSQPPCFLQTRSLLTSAALFLAAAGSAVSGNAAQELTASAAPGVPPVFTIQPAGQVIFGTAPVSAFVVDASGDPAPTYQWLFNGIPIAGARDSSFTPDATVDNAGVYSVVAANTAGSVTSSVVTLSFWRIDPGEGDAMNLTIHGAIGFPYRVDYRDSFFGAWTTLAPLILNTNPKTVVDPAGRLQAVRFYRVAQVPIPRFPAAPRRTESGTELRLECELNRRIEIHASTDLITWTRLVTLTNTTGIVTYEDPAIPAEGGRFYKAIQLSP
jgi:hypothetical protein